MFHRRISTPNSDGQVPTLCGRVVDYQQANGSLTNVDCPVCIGHADVLINTYTAACRVLVDDLLAKPSRKPAS